MGILKVSEFELRLVVDGKAVDFLTYHFGVWRFEITPRNYFSFRIIIFFSHIIINSRIWWLLIKYRF